LKYALVCRLRRKALSLNVFEERPELRAVHRAEGLRLVDLS
jgi:hypothetical protein